MSIKWNLFLLYLTLIVSSILAGDVCNSCKSTDNSCPTVDLSCTEITDYKGTTSCVTTATGTTSSVAKAIASASAIGKAVATATATATATAGGTATAIATVTATSSVAEISTLQERYISLLASRKTERACCTYLLAAENEADERPKLKFTCGHVYEYMQL